MFASCSRRAMYRRYGSRARNTPATISTTPAAMSARPSSPTPSAPSVQPLPDELGHAGRVGRAAGGLHHLADEEPDHGLAGRMIGDGLRVWGEHRVDVGGERLVAGGGSGPRGGEERAGVGALDEMPVEQLAADGP